MTCKLCCSQDVLPFYSYNSFTLVQCPDCRLIYQEDMEKINTLNMLYDTYNIHWIAMRDHAVRSTFGDHVAFQLLLLETFSPKKGQLLEIGSGTGEFMYAAKQAGWSVTGIEPSPLSQAYVKSKYDIDLIPSISNLTENVSLISQMEEGNTQYDVIVFWHVLEHIDEPLPFLSDMRSKLNRSGKMYVSVPNQHSFINEVLGTSSPLYTEADHLYHYSVANLYSLFTQADLHIDTIFTRQLPEAFYVLVDQHTEYQKYSFTERMGLFAKVQAEQRGHEICCVMSKKED
ncbi:2-polyprenyl-3-methyl-5-hydroxy-6-metoxy-1,4-benzoquinol methylase [Paenibacillus shirakamiensis]|uniref:2-polyprenyl-3-methyl-5-hydroxy-6-metoxy-1, 4-benzoquinol methylase n=1 Tax=Paenibacillus shirakamiensis TaxID=1265935 RepID=A0ABS4JDW0_9BACL|nr:class I SAM-dependent methyltransferase [Paenibacillus shirakamiensis]MBP1999897.1 2-polyprenyl-3-methyl-5-hydroxy-6-metoxy-1,4-benzoquinol methylase [Paenibacillus shirakamiensis]